MKRIIFIILIFSIAIPVSKAQLWKMRRYELVGGAGPSFFFGDVGGFSHSDNILGLRDLTFLQTRFNINGNIKFRITRDINIRLSLTYALLRANDDRGSNVERDFDATTSIFETAVIGEYYFVKNQAENSYIFVSGKGPFIAEFIKSLDFYAFAGIGGLSYTVQGNDALITSGMETEGFTSVIPGGLGATLIFTPNINFGIEVGGRYAFTDYLDGYTSQYSKANDVYYFLNFAITYKLKTGPTGLPSFR
jgi:hypothetical protein